MVTAFGKMIPTDEHNLRLIPTDQLDKHQTCLAEDSLGRICTRAT